MKIGYIRISTTDQNIARQELLMEQLGVDEVYIDRMSGKNTNRPELQKMMEYVRRGDTVIVESISRFYPQYPRPAGAGGEAIRQGRGVRQQEGSHRHHHAYRQVYADRIRRGGGTGTRVYSSVPTGRHRHCQG